MLACGFLIPKRLRAFVVLCTSAALLSSGCNSPDRVLDIPAAENSAPNSIEAIKDYQQALSAIVRVIVRELKLPEPQGGYISTATPEHIKLR